MSLREKIRQLPEALQKVALYRGLVGCISLILFVAVMAFTVEFRFAFPCLLLSVYMIVNTAFLIYNCVRGRYVMVKGECLEIERTAIRKKLAVLHRQNRGQYPDGPCKTQNEEI